MAEWKERLFCASALGAPLLAASVTTTRASPKSWIKTCLVDTFKRVQGPPKASSRVREDEAMGSGSGPDTFANRGPVRTGLPNGTGHVVSPRKSRRNRPRPSPIRKAGRGGLIGTGHERWEGTDLETRDRTRRPPHHPAPLPRRGEGGKSLKGSWSRSWSTTFNREFDHEIVDHEGRPIRSGHIRMTGRVAKSALTPALSQRTGRGGRRGAPGMTTPAGDNKSSPAGRGSFFHLEDRGRKRSAARLDKLSRRVRLNVVPPGRVSHN